MSKRHKNIIWLFVLAFVVAESMLILVSTLNFRAKRDHILMDRTSELKTSYEAIFNTYSLVSRVIYEQIVNTPEITELYSRAYKSNEIKQAEIRDSIFQILYPTYLELDSYSIKQLHFHFPDNSSFLRFHSPTKFGDDLSDVRESVRIANVEKRFVQGFEEGRIYNGFRFVYPLSYDGEHIGTVETSISFGAISQMLHKQAKNVYSFIMKKSVVDDKVFIEEQSNYILSAISDQWVEENRFLHYTYPSEGLPREVLSELDKIIRKEHQNKLDEGLPFSVYISLNKSKYTVSFVPILNIKGNHVAYVMSYGLDTYSNSYINSVNIFIGGGSLVLLIIAALFFVIYSRNITIQKQQGALFESESRYMQIYNTVDIGIITSNIDGSILMANPKLVNILGYESLKEFKKLNINDIYLNPELRERWVADLLSKKIVQINEEIIWKKKDGSKINVRISGQYHIGFDGVPFLEALAQDVTELRLLEKSLKTSESDLRQSNAAKDRFFSILGHDLRGPFSSLLGLTEIIALHPETLDEERKNHYIQLIYSSVKNLSNLITNLLEWSRSQQGILNYEPKEIGLESMVNETLELLNEPAFAKQIVVSSSIDKSIILFADENMSKTIFRNLIGNAIKFTHSEGLVRIFTSREINTEGQNLIEIIVEDNGVGMSQDELDKLFQIDSGFTNKGTNDEKGTGLGLVLVQEFVKKHSGTIVIESEKGMGTKAIFTLPIVS